MCRRGNEQFDRCPLYISNWLRPYAFRRMLEKMGSMRKEMDGGVFMSRQSRHFSFVTNMVKLLFPTLHLDLACKQVIFPPSKGTDKSNENTNIIIYNSTGCQ